ncbi:phosphate ABC transporter substrate-binding protein PstS [Helcobacillus massiliensis]|uniref:phosphate ABC transporter substrate-binding protein PstS n=1 Tax=Helcobacillus massiliensis TaxID=521392 RepID=UPI0021A41B65|nr:phosphate ABC transporter substrate-binding protein PstS [Helcobacillus massiliensis]MCT1556585.1 phosphate ABC transporter substrate-binding protein PstS [Helcobacillus massiliensis]MCT2035779.1 phosphate ABC transporter substrate-binding protein PstS [Helcobacillus massiliensis]MCT2331139.1 phosphate ABC transporter substrate-binding protein PstS [Helcobacillus massiliensis]
MNVFSRKTIAALGAVSVLALSACGSDGGKPVDGGKADTGKSDSKPVSGKLVGSGASSQGGAQDAWLAGFTAQNPEAQVTYDATGSGKGREAFLSKASDFAGTDDFLDEEEMTKAKDRCEGGTAMNIPVYISPIAVVYNLEGVDDLQLSPETLAGIFAGTITKWDDPKIKADNPDAELPSKPIVPVHRSDKSGTTGNFTDYLSKAAPNEWTHGAIEEWYESGGQSGDKTAGMMSTVKGGDGTIGYADASQAKDVGVAKIKVGEKFVELSAEGAGKTVDDSKPVKDGDLALELNRTTTADGAYPLVLVSYMAVCDTYDSQEKADLVKAYASFIISEQGQKDAESSSGSAPLPAEMSKKAQENVDKIKAK